jgi:hypothetical protein
MLKKHLKEKRYKTTKMKKRHSCYVLSIKLVSFLNYLCLSAVLYTNQQPIFKENIEIRIKLIEQVQMIVFLLVNYFHIFLLVLLGCRYRRHPHHSVLLHLIIINWFLHSNKSYQERREKKKERLVKRSSFLYIYIIISAHNLI